MDPGAWLNIASGLGMAALGAVVLLANPRKDWNRVFALFALFWGAQIVSANFVRIAVSEGEARLAGELTLAFLIPLYFFLAAFAGIFPQPRPPFGSSLAIALLALPAAGALVALFAVPGSLVASVVAQPGGGFGLRWGPLLPYLVTAPFFGALFYALHAMTQRLAEAPSPTERRQVALVLAALALYAGHVTPLEFARFGAAVAGFAPAEAASLEAAVIAGIMGIGLVLLARLALVLGALRRTTAAAAADARIVLMALGLGVGSAITLEAWAVLGNDPIEVLGLLRLGSVALIGYGILRVQLFDIDVRVKDVGPAVAALLAVAALGAAAWALVPGLDIGADWRAPLVAVVALAAFLPLVRVFGRVADLVAPQVSREGDHLYLRKLEVYRAAVEAVLRDGKRAAAEEPGLAEQRRALGLSERDHGIAVSLALSRAEAAPAAPDLRPGTVVFGKYHIESLLAEGGFGRVFLARDRVLGRPVVLKELQARWRGDANVLRTFLREAQIAGSLSHPHIVPVHAVEQHGQDHVVVMEHLPGGTLGDRLRSGPLAPREAVRIADAVLDALAAAHAKGVVHRDVKPENVLFDGHGTPKLADFGIATLAGEEPERTLSGLTTGAEPRFQPGTLQYMSPEQARGAPVDARSDLYAVGAVLFRMLSGQPHVRVAGLGEFAARQVVAAAAAPSEVPGAPAALAQVVRRALEPDPAARFASANQFREALQEAAQVREHPRRTP